MNDSFFVIKNDPREKNGDTNKKRQKNDNALSRNFSFLYKGVMINMQGNARGNARGKHRTLINMQGKARGKHRMIKQGKRRFFPILILQEFFLRN